MTWLLTTAIWSTAAYQLVVWIQSFPSPMTPAHDRQGLMLNGCDARRFGQWLLIGYLQLTYTHTYTCTHLLLLLLLLKEVGTCQGERE